MVWYGLTAVTVFKGQIRHLPSTSPIDCIDKISKEQFLACSARRRSVPPGPPPPLSCGSSAGSFQPAPCMLQHRRWYLAAWMMLAVQAAVPRSRVRELPDRTLDYRTTAIKVRLVSQVRLQSWRAQNRSGHVRDEEKRSTKKWRLWNRATQLQGLVCVLSFTLIILSVFCSIFFALVMLLHFVLLDIHENASRFLVEKNFGYLNINVL